MPPDWLLTMSQLAAIGASGLAMPLFDDKSHCGFALVQTIILRPVCQNRDAATPTYANPC